MLIICHRQTLQTYNVQLYIVAVYIYTHVYTYIHHVHTTVYVCINYMYVCSYVHIYVCSICMYVRTYLCMYRMFGYNIKIVSMAIHNRPYAYLDIVGCKQDNWLTNTSCREKAKEIVIIMDKSQCTLSEG